MSEPKQAPTTPVPSSGTTSKPPPRRISGQLMLSPEVLEMKKEQEEAKKRTQRILAMVSSRTEEVRTSENDPRIEK